MLKLFQYLLVFFLFVVRKTRSKHFVKSEK